eukprot:5929382-Amphidinium_carterae.1
MSCPHPDATGRNHTRNFTRVLVPRMISQPCWSSEMEAMNPMTNQRSQQWPQKESKEIRSLALASTHHPAQASKRARRTPRKAKSRRDARKEPDTDSSEETSQQFASSA